MCARESLSGCVKSLLDVKSVVLMREKDGFFFWREGRLSMFDDVQRVSLKGDSRLRVGSCEKFSLQFRGFL